ncbi:hypothetical protein BCR41DRAFT_348321 [Lobosporangium transversale]|uniref:CBS domain-containing protein n=1 Tax=Lobosporangium transversale TaxID=64571 RepID=A0A1Y2GVW3_9FUNG|nr:hypothetical protein BCR41DRAFT_348321 [Lobosporangium transversale]ORZ26440.1 hypothetical protein BCR41DRAFT_348321 [Lobosporangium transversale]|eukprot:XP_021884205.1 hypothetical protein BCR41DRAFT_348321 [Lobosporangium transversale]
MTSQHAAFLASKTVADVLNEKAQNHALIDIPVTATVEKVFETLQSNDILSVPVYRRFNNVKDYVAIIDTYDLLSTMEERGFTVESGSTPDTEYLSMPVAILVGMTKSSSKLWTCQPNLPLTQLIELFTKHRVHRILVLEEIPVKSSDIESNENVLEEAEPQQEPKGRLVSQTDVIRYLLAHNHELGPILDRTANSIAGHALQFSDAYLDSASADKLKQAPATITINNPAWTALQKMSSAHASCVAVVDTDGTLVSEMSAADLRGVNPSRIQDLNKPVLVYLKTLQGGNLKRPLSCRAQFSLGQVLSGLIRSHAHRSWLVDGEDRPVGCITLSDILSVFLG